MVSSTDSQCHKCGITISAYEEEPHVCAKNNVIPTTAGRVPDERHYALLVWDTIPATPTYVAYADKDVWLQEIKNLEEAGKQYSALRAIPARVKRIVEIEVYDDRGKKLSPEKKNEVSDD